MTGRGQRDEKEGLYRRVYSVQQPCPRLLRFVVKSAEGGRGMNTC